MKFLSYVHGKHVHPRRVQVLGKHIAPMLPKKAKVLDVGCGDGLLAQYLLQLRPDLSIEGIEVRVRKKTAIPVKRYDGTNIPHADQSFDVVLCIDIIHHAEKPMQVLQEAKRVGKSIIIKDHRLKGILAEETLCFMDWIGNIWYGVSLPYSYWTEQQWKKSFQQLGLKNKIWKTHLEIYPLPASLIFDRSLHFIAKLERK